VALSAGALGHLRALPSRGQGGPGRYPAGPTWPSAQKVPYRTAVQFIPGLNARVSLTVGASDTASAMRSGTVEVLGTPRLIALCEEAACLALAKSLPDSHTTVGVRVQFDHLAPVQTGSEVTAEAVLERVEGRRLVFTVSATDSAGLVGAGRVTRVLVETEAFLAKAR
jgi:fluoroacetyl-CoA thioesterase